MSLPVLMVYILWETHTTNPTLMVRVMWRLKNICQQS